MPEVHHADEETLPKVVEIVKTQFCGQSNKHFAEELPTNTTKLSKYNPDALDFLEIADALEEEFGIEVSDLDQEKMQEEDWDCRDIAEYVAKMTGAL